MPIYATYVHIYIYFSVFCTFIQLILYNQYALYALYLMILLMPYCFTVYYIASFCYPEHSFVVCMYEIERGWCAESQLSLFVARVLQ